MKETRVERKRRKRRFIIKIIVFMLFIAACVVFSLKSSFFQINEINILGNYKLETDEILRASGLKLGDNILLVSNSQVRSNITNIPYA